MRIAAPRVDLAQRETLHRRREQLQAPAGVIDVLRRHLGGASAREVDFALQDESPDRFVLRVDAVAHGGVHTTYAFKVYADDRGARLWRIARALRAHVARTAGGCPLCLPLAYVPELGLTVYPWVQGHALRDAIRRGDAALLAQAAESAASTLAWVHRACIPAEAPRSAQAAFERACHRCAKFSRWPDAERMVRPLLAALGEALPALERSTATFVHGDPGPANLLFDGRRWTLIDLDRCGYGDPAQDVGYLLAQIARRCLEQPALALRVPQTTAALEAAYRAEMPQVPARNIAFYYAITLAQKLFMTWREHPADPRAAVRPLVQRALAALRERAEG